MLKNLTKVNPKIGIIINCKKIPRHKILKFLKIFKKFSNLRVNPIENITKLSKGIIRKVKLAQYCGCKKAQNEKIIIQRGNKLVEIETNCFIKIKESYKLQKI